ncbi:hypothetical protein MSPP1_001616 [Malassezia sp. CBS 17886]|nr:hypothetical protein MSPP1_001616 [Malassezia sp. CBS 17886]
MANASEDGDGVVQADGSGANKGRPNGGTDADEHLASIRPHAASRGIPAPERGILRPAAPMGGSHALWLGREFVYTLNSRLAQQNVPVNVPLPPHNASAAVTSLLGGVWRRWSGVERAQASAGTPTADTRVPALKAVRFRIEDLAHTYPIAGDCAPGTEAETRVRVDAEHTKRLARFYSRALTPQELQRLYRLCCRAREERPNPAVVQVLDGAQRWADARVRTLDLTGIDLAKEYAPVADLLSARLGVDALLLEDCGLTDRGIHAFAHAVHASASVRRLSVAGNGALRDGWRALGALLQESTTLRHLDVSENALSRVAMERLLAPLLVRTARAPLDTLRVEQCALRTATVDVMAHAVRGSCVRHLSLRRNGLPAEAANALALLLRDYADAAHPAVVALELEHAFPTPPLYATHEQSVVAAALVQDEARAAGRARAEMLRTLVARARAFQHALARTPVLGGLQTLDLKTNQLRGGIAPLAAALRRNRRLRVLSLADNELDPSALALLGDALRYNTSLETLDMSHNPCAGPDIAGVHSLRVALAVHPRLKRVFLPGTCLVPEAAVALAECLPDVSQLVHLDVVRNPIGIVGLMALAEGIQRSVPIRCLDVDVKTNNDQWVRTASTIYDVCRRNTDAAQARASTTAAKQLVRTPLERSALVTALAAEKEDDLPEALALNEELGGAIAAAVQRSPRADAPDTPAAKTLAETLAIDTAVPLKDEPASPALSRANGLLCEESAVFRMAMERARTDDTSAGDASGDSADTGAATARLGEPLYDEEKSGDELRKQLLDRGHG